MTDEQTERVPPTKEDARKAMDAAFALGLTAGRAEVAPVEFPNRLIHQMPGGEAGYRAYEAELSAKVFELRSRGVRNVRTHAEVLAIKERYER
ncbi:MAG: hypothetical protein IIA89_02045 [Chloroflexi bacterium]|nr:hypothetical protein [Chloroflexota bacterium]